MINTYSLINEFSTLNNAKLIDNNLLNDIIDNINANINLPSVQSYQSNIYILDDIDINEIVKKIKTLVDIKLIPIPLYNNIGKSIVDNYKMIANKLGNNWFQRFLTRSLSSIDLENIINNTDNTNGTDHNQPISNNFSTNNSTNNTTQQVFKQNSTLNKDMLNLPPILQVKELTKKYKGKEFPAIDKISFNVYPGQFHAFIGANGAGKTTTIKSIIDAYSKYNLSGEIKINNISNYLSEAKRVIGYIPESANFPKKMKTGDYLVSMCMLDGYSKKDAMNITKEILEKLDLINLINNKPANFSSGQKKKILLAQALIHKPKLLVLDEPAANLDPLARDELFNTLVALQKEGTAIFISSHILDEIAKYATYVTILDGGKIVYDNPIETHTDLNSLYKQHVKKGSVDLIIH